MEWESVSLEQAQIMEALGAATQAMGADAVQCALNIDAMEKASDAQSDPKAKAAYKEYSASAFALAVTTHATVVGLLAQFAEKVNMAGKPVPGDQPAT